MKLLVTVAGSLKFDTRVKRHAAYLSECFSETEVLCLPRGDKEIHLSGGKIKQTFAPLPTMRDGTKGGGLARQAQKLGLFAPLAAAFPWAALSMPSPPQDYHQKCLEAQKTQLAAESFADVRNAACAPDSPNDLVNLFAILGGWLAMAHRAVQIPADVVLCNDLDTLFCGVAHKLKYGSRLVYDAHEIYFDQTVGGQPRIWKNTMPLLERELIQHADYVTGVSESLVNWLRKTYAFGAPSAVLPNSSRFAPPKAYPPKALAQNGVRLYYHGVSDESRGIEGIINALPFLPGEYSAVLRLLPSDNLAALKAEAQKAEAENRIGWPAPVSADDIVQKSREDGDIGVFTPSPSMAKCVNYTVVLANKLIEYLKAGLPVISTPWQEHTRILSQYNAGIIVPNGTGEEVAAAAREIAQDPQKYEEMSANALRAAKELFSWEQSAKKLADAAGVPPV